jgi:hypothetical protein
MIRGVKRSARIAHAMLAMLGATVVVLALAATALAAPGSPPSKPKLTPLPAVTETAQVTLSWSASKFAVDSVERWYEVEALDQTINDLTTTKVEADDARTLDVGLEDAHTYRFRVRAVQTRCLPVPQTVQDTCVEERGGRSDAVTTRVQLPTTTTTDPPPVDPPPPPPPPAPPEPTPPPAAPEPAPVVAVATIPNLIKPPTKPVATSRLVAPKAGARPLAGRALRLRWRSDRGASYYNVQLFRAGRKVLSVWPRTPAYVIPARRLLAGKLTVLVWSGRGAMAQARYVRRPWLVRALAVRSSSVRAAARTS